MEVCIQGESVKWQSAVQNNCFCSEMKLCYKTVGLEADYVIWPTKAFPVNKEITVRLTCEVRGAVVMDCWLDES